MEVNANDRLSKAASVIYRMRTAEPDPMGDPSGDCGDMIAAYNRSRELRAVLAAGYQTPGEYNAELRDRMVLPYGRYTLKVRELLMLLEIEDVCECGAALESTRHRTASYGGGWGTYVRCNSCGYAEVYA